MAKFYGPVGYVVDTPDGVDITTQRPYEKNYKGDLVKNRRKLQDGVSTADDIVLSNQISIVADPYAMSHIFAIRYVKWMGSPWKVIEVEVEYPRLILTIGGLYNGEVADSSK